MGTDNYITTTEFNFDKEGFFNLIDADRKLDNEWKQALWGEYALFSKKNLEDFYNSLDDVAPTHQYVKKSIAQFFLQKGFRVPPK